MNLKNRLKYDLQKNILFIDFSYLEIIEEEQIEKIKKLNGVEHLSQDEHIKKAYLGI